MVIKSLRFDLGGKSAGPKGSPTPDDAILVLSGAGIAREFDRVMVVVEGTDRERNKACLAIKAAFSREVKVQKDSSRGYETSLDQIISDIAAGVSAKSKFALGVAICKGSSVTAGSFGGARGLILRADNWSIDHFGGGADDSPNRTSRHTLAESDTIVLLGAGLGEFLTDSQVRHTIQASEVDNAAAWLVTLASGQISGQRSALVAKVEPSVRPKQSLSNPDRARPRRMPVLLTPRTIRFGAVASAALAAVIAAAAVLSASTSGFTLRAPMGLRLVQVQAHSAILNWRAVEHAVRYQVQVNHHSFESTAPLLNLNSLASSHWYSWQVRALNGEQKSPWAYGQVIDVPFAQVPFGRPAAISPGRRLPATAASSVRLCWTAPAASTSFDLALSGGGHRIRSRLAKSGVQIRPKTFCKSEVLSTGASFSWRIGAVSPANTETWTHWRHFRIASPPPVRVVTTTPPQTSSSTSTTTTTTPQQPVTTPAQTTTSPPVTQPQTTTQPPASTAPSTSTSPVQQCSNPPHC